MTSKAEAPAASSPAGEPIQCDVMILGSGLAGSITGAILARQGAKVALVDAGHHPRFSVGESQNPQLVEWLHILAVRYDVPEIKYLLDIKAVTKNLGAHHGRKQSFGFVSHRPGREPDPREATMFIIPKMLTEATHMHRQDTDAFYLAVAAKYGCVVRQDWRATDIDFDDDGVTVTSAGGEVFRAKYLIDASGFRSPLAQKFSLREQPSRLKHHARSMFTHYVGIKPYDEVCNYPADLLPPQESPFHGGTLHHVIERGWFWIIPFNNHPDSRNPLCSVGLTFDERTYPKPKDMTPDQEFNKYLDMYPAIKRQFEGASRVREWVSTDDRIQYSSKQTVGPRWCLMSHAAGFVDPLYSRGLSNTFEVVDALCWRVLDALRDNDFSVERFEYVERLEQGLLDYNDKIVNASYIAFDHFRLWNAVFRVWACFTTPATMRLVKARQDWLLEGKNDDVFKRMENAPYPGLWWPDSHAFKYLLDTTHETCERYEAGEIDGDKAADLVFEAIRNCESVNTPFGWKGPEDLRYFRASTPTMIKFLWWCSTQAPGEMRDLGRSFVSGTVRQALRGKKLT
ncbi:NAD(P)/FAD-dependent oxidoreductase [Streptomyces sp. HPF1205]|uniref:NAD(P)/FAD-dependent oxidoreductase n=1 Tax=Streptomyces sp. HPF1205 TaxID=2873262 RepID=UPI001CECDF4E|nr:tryptophan 7-halogenase [Streptomyces sp. HPF1205]